MEEQNEISKMSVDQDDKKTSMWHTRLQAIEPKPKLECEKSMSKVNFSITKKEGLGWRTEDVGLLERKKPFGEVT